MVCAGSIRWLMCGTRVFIGASRRRPILCRKSKNWRRNMILLRPDCLVFKTSSGENVPCSAQQVTLELLGDAVNQMDEEVVQNAAHAVLHYFRTELERTFVTIGEFAETLATVLRKLGLDVKTSAPDAVRRVVDSDLGPLVATTQGVCELVFFQTLRAELRNHLETAPQVVRFNGLRG